MKYTFGTRVYLLQKPDSTDFVDVDDSFSNYLFTEMMNTDCMLDRDYQGWVDFGRRHAKWQKEHRPRAPSFVFVQIFYERNISVAQSL